MRGLLRSVLRANGYRTLEAGTSKEGQEIAMNALPDFIFVDLGLPDGDGVDLIRRVREWSSVPIFVLSGRDRLHDKVAGLNAGADDYLTKPFVPDELLARVRAVRRERTVLSRTRTDSTPRKRPPCCAPNISVTAHAPPSGAWRRVTGRSQLQPSQQGIYGST